MKCILSIDVEDWFHILDTPSTPGMSTWDTLPSRIEANFLKLLDIFSEYNVRTTCFFLGWIAKRFPHLVLEANQRGHEIASHGYAHQLVYDLTPEQFYSDVVRAKKTLEDTSGCRVDGYRAPGFSVGNQTPWFFDQLIRAGYLYDSSIFPASHGHGGFSGGPQRQFCALGQDGLASLLELPMTIINIGPASMCFFGGGYLRLFPWCVIKLMTNKVLRQGRPVIFYIHPREIDPDQPRLQMSTVRAFKCYVNLESAEQKLRSLLQEFGVTTFRDYIATNVEQPIDLLGKEVYFKQVSQISGRSFKANAG